MANSSKTSIGSLLKLAAIPLVLASLSACTQTFDANVKRFQSELPAPAGQSFAIVSDDPALAGGLEFSQYARLVEAQMVRLGYATSDPAHASLIVRFDYGVDKGRERVQQTSIHDPFFSPWYGYRGIGYGGGYGRGYGRYASHGLWGYGWYDPWFDGGYESYTVYTSGISLKIDSRNDGRRLFEGKAEAVSTSNRLPYLVPNLVEAMFTDFPGHSGETVRISVAPEKKTR
ncbi:MAG: DUF4136 domain-containing protein [Novosphingobium sp.]